MTQHHSQAAAMHVPPRRLRRSHRRLLVSNVVAAVAVVLIVTGCTTPQVSPSPSTTGSSTTPPVETTAPAPPPTTAAPVYKPASDQGPAENVPVPVLPETAKEFSKEGLESFAEYWYSTLSYVYETGDSTPMMAITDPSCKTCAFINEPIGQLYDAGGWVTGGQMRVIQSTTNFDRAADGSYQAILMVQQAKLAAYDADKVLRNEHEQEPAQPNMVVAEYVDQHWNARSSEPMGQG